MNEVNESGKLTLTDNDFYKLREDLYNKLKEHENTTNEILKAYKDNSDKINNNCILKCEEFSVKLEEINNITLTYKLKLEKIPELDKFKTSSSDQIYTQNVKLINIQTELTKACNKYDKIYLENLELPGTIGEFCKYKNLREYNEVISFNE